MKSYYQYSSIFTKTGFYAGLISNSIFIYLTVFHIKKVTGTYKKMVIFFAVLGVIFSGWELFAQPFMQNYDKALVYFSLSTGAPQVYFQFAIAFYSTLYESILAFISIQFVYRYLTLFHPDLMRKFDGKGIFWWIFYPFLPGAIYGSSLYLYCQPDNYADDYVREEMMSNYGLPIEEVPRFLIVSYNADNTFRWNSLAFLVQGISVVGIHYLIILYFGVKMKLNMKKKLEEHSNTYRRLQKQFFKALVVQTLVPTFLFVLPAGPILLGPLFSPIFNIKISLQTGWLCAVFSLFPPIDSIAFMIIVTEYKKVIRERLHIMVPLRETATVGYSTTDSRARPISMN